MVQNINKTVWPANTPCVIEHTLKLIAHVPPCDSDTPVPKLVIIKQGLWKVTLQEMIHSTQNHRVSPL